MRLRDDGRPAADPERLGIPISGDDEAKRTVAEQEEALHVPTVVSQKHWT
jgi:hypothetical protein